MWSQVEPRLQLLSSKEHPQLGKASLTTPLTRCRATAWAKIESFISQAVDRREISSEAW
jgi:hypothetical protein